MDYKKVLASYTYKSDVTIRDRIAHSNGSDTRENKDIINEIVLWKINRSVTISNELICRIRNLQMGTPLEAAHDTNVTNIIMDLLNSDGIQIAMASTILKMFHPNIFPIIDQRAYREIYNKEMPKYYAKDSNIKYAFLYQNYIEKCYCFQQEYCSEFNFGDIDKILYQVDKRKGLKIKY